MQNVCEGIHGVGEGCGVGFRQRSAFIGLSVWLCILEFLVLCVNEFSVEPRSFVIVPSDAHVVLIAQDHGYTFFVERVVRKNVLNKF